MNNNLPANFFITMKFDINDMNTNTRKFHEKFINLKDVSLNDKVFITEDGKITKELESNYNILNGEIPYIQSLSRWWNDQGREQLFTYLDNSFTEYMRFLTMITESLQDSESRPMYKSVAKKNKELIEGIIPGLYNLKKTYEDYTKLTAKIDSIVLTFMDYMQQVDGLLDKHKQDTKISSSRIDIHGNILMTSSDDSVAYSDDFCGSRETIDSPKTISK